MIPSMGGTEIGPILRKYASQVKSGQAIVELGCWLGAGTRQLLDGVQQSGNGAVVHSFDKFRVSEQQRRKAAVHGVRLKDSFKEFTSTFASDLASGCLVVHKGPIGRTVWNGVRIGLHVDDACKRQTAFDQAIKIFSPSWVPNVTVLVLMDFWYFTKRSDPGLRYQYEWMEKHKDQFLSLAPPDSFTCTAVFRYLGGLNNVS